LKYFLKFTIVAVLAGIYIPAAPVYITKNGFLGITATASPAPTISKTVSYLSIFYPPRSEDNLPFVDELMQSLLLTTLSTSPSLSLAVTLDCVTS